MSARTRKDWILWGALGCALVSTAHAEYTLATATGTHPWVALAVPGALDLYVIRALLSRREVPFAVLVMVAANVASHLITAGVLEASTSVIASVGALAPVLLWRIYALKHAGTPHSPVLEDPGAVSAPVLAPVLAPSTPAWVPGYHLDGCDGLHSLQAPWECAQRADVLAASTAAPDHVPASWMEEEYPETYPSKAVLDEYAITCVAHSLPECDECTSKYGSPEASTRTHLRALPDLPPEYASGAVTESIVKLQPSDFAYLPGAQEYADLHGKVTIKGLKEALSIGQDRAVRLLAHLEMEEES